MLSVFAESRRSSTVFDSSGSSVLYRIVLVPGSRACVGVILRHLAKI